MPAQLDQAGCLCCHKESAVSWLLGCLQESILGLDWTSAAAKSLEMARKLSATIQAALLEPVIQDLVDL